MVQKWSFMTHACGALEQKPPFLHLQRVLAGQTPDRVVAERLTAKPALATAKPSGRAGLCDITKARLVAESEGGVTT
jgi:hypothetical protein